MEDDSPAARQRREILNASILKIYPSLCAITGGVILKLRPGLKDYQVADLATEAVHEAFRRALEKAEHYDPSRRPDPWIMRFVLNVLKESNRQRKKQPTQADVGDEAWQKALDVFEAGIPSESNDERVLHLRQALSKLTQAQREILDLHHGKKWDGEQLAHAIGAPSAGAARTRLTRAHQALRDAIQASIKQEEKP
jgi:RNA polymerase sigma factor (sigma-70 family)